MMKKLIYLFICFSLFVTTSCQMEEENIFGKYPTERMEELTQLTKETLISAPNGWLMEYFATLDSVGYPLLVKFESTKKVTVAKQVLFTDVNWIILQGEYYESSSVFDVINEEMSLLKFSTENDLIQLFANPEMTPKGIGLNGDYEFHVKEIKGDKIYMRGKKRNAEIIFTKLPSTVNWKDYLQHLQDFEDKVFKNNIAPFQLYVGDKAYTVTKTHGDFIFYIHTGALFPISVPFVITEEGFRFVRPITLDNKTFQYFRFNQSAGSIVSIEDNSVAFLGPDLSQLFLTLYLPWTLQNTEMSSELGVLYDKVVTSAKTSPTITDVQSVNISFKRSNAGQLSLEILLTKSNEAKVRGNLYFNDNTLGVDQHKLTYSGQADGNGILFLNRIEGLSDLANALSGEYNLESTNRMNVIDIKFVNKLDTNTWFRTTR